MSEYFSKPNSLGANIKVELNLSNQAPKTDLKDAAGVDTSSFAKKTDLANLKPVVDKLESNKLKNVPSILNNLKSKIDKVDIDELESVPVDLSKLNNVKMMLLKKDVYR